MLLYWRFRYVTGHLSGKRQVVAGFLVIQFGLMVCLMPITALLFKQVSLIGLVANLIALPVISLLIMPALFIAILLLFIHETAFVYLIAFIELALSALWQVLTQLGAFDYAALTLSRADILLLCLVLTCCACYCLVAAKERFASRMRVYLPSVIAISAVLFISGYRKVMPTNWQLTVLDVGQGLSVVISKNGRGLVYDTGNIFPSGWNLAEQAVLPFLAYHDLEVDYLVLSHDDSDHAGGAKQILARHSKALLVFNQQLEQAEHFPHILCQQGKVIHWQGLTLSMLWPKTIAAKENDDSCVIKVSDGQSSVLLTGDISTQVEAQLTKQPIPITADIIIAPHHGRNRHQVND